MKGLNVRLRGLKEDMGEDIEGRQGRARVQAGTQPGE